MSTHIGDAWRAAGLLPIAMAVQCTGSIAPGPGRIRDFRHRLVDATISNLDQTGHWWWLREAALWQDPAILSENEQLAVVLNELADPDHPEHSGTSVITSTLEAEGVRRARDASGSQGRLTEQSWRFWSREAGLNPDHDRGPKPEFYESLWAEPNETAEDEDDDQRSYVLLDDEREIFVGKP